MYARKITDKKMGISEEKINTPDHVYYIFGIYLVVAFILGLTLNTFVTSIFCRLFKKKPNTVNLILINIGVANTLQTCPPLLWATINSFMREYVLGHTICLVDSVWVTGCAILVINLLAYLGYERYLMVKEMRTTETQVYTKSILLIGGCWIYSLMWGIMPIFGWSRYGIEGIGISCSVKWDLRTLAGISYTACLFLASYVVPIAVICITYYKTWKLIKHSESRIKPDQEISKSNKVQQTHKKVAVMGFLMAGAFFLTWTPYAIVSFMSYVNPAIVTPLRASIPAIFAKTSTIYYPLICASKHNGFKAEYRRALERKTCQTSTTILESQSRIMHGRDQDQTNVEC